MVPISKREASHPLEKAHFCHLYPHSKFCGLYPELFDQLDGPPYLQCPGNAVKVLPEVGVEDLFDSGLSQTFPEHPKYAFTRTRSVQYSPRPSNPTQDQVVISERLGLFIRVLRTYGCRSNDTITKSTIDLWPGVFFVPCALMDILMF